MPAVPPLRLGTALVRLLPIAAVVVVVLAVATTLAVAGDTLGYDFRAYHAAAARVWAGLSAYDLDFTLAGAFGLFFYPPSFLPLVLPFGLLDAGVATWLWIALLASAFAGAVAAMPVETRVKWWIVLLAGLSWPFVYNMKLGQVGPLLLLGFALAWRWLERPAGFGIAAAVGAALKLQPGILLGWALLTRRWRALAAGIVALAVLVLAGTLITGVDGWFTFAGLLARVSDPIVTPQNCTPGAVLWQMGVDRGIAGAVQVAWTATVVLVVVVAALRLPPVASFLAFVIATQLVSPILWDHYAVILLLPVAWLLDRGHRWAMLIPLATSLFLVGEIPPAVYPVAFVVVLAAVFREGQRMPGPAVG